MVKTEEYSTRLLMTLSQDDYEAGMSTNTEKVLEDLRSTIKIDKFTEVIIYLFNKLIDENKIYQLGMLLRAFSHLYNEFYIKITNETIFDQVVNFINNETNFTKVFEVADSLIGCIENYEDPLNIPFLEKLDLRRTKFLEEYRDKIIEYLKKV